MRKIVVILFVLNCLFEGVYGQISINYMEEIPVVDGYLDQNLDKINLTEMTAIYKTREDNPDVPVHYLAGYTDNYFYLYIEAEADHIIERDRAYQNGDGFHLMIGKPQPANEATDEFYILGFSPQKNWSHKMVWYYNVDLSMQRLGDEVLFATNEDKGKIGFELLLPWRSVAPYHPWLGKIGLNLCFVKAIGGNEKNHHFITMDGRMQSEQSLRKYVPAEFEKPNQSTEIVSALTANHIRSGESFSVNVRKWEQQDSQTTISIKFSSGENKIVNFHKEKVTWKTGFNEILISPAQNLMPGGYK